MTLSVVIPAFESAATIARCLDALSQSRLPPGDALEVLVVDDGSTDATAEIAARHGARVRRVAGGPRGPAAARNLGAAETRGDVLVFVDADVAVHPDTVAGLACALTPPSDVAAVFGSYDDTPADASMLSQYRNLLHHYVHQHGRPEATTFWAGCGAIRRDVFAAVGGFDERFARPSIEDIELGGRLVAAGHRVRLCPDVQATHLKRWTFAGIVRSDIRDRAIPWSRLVAERRHVPRDLNLSLRSRLGAVAAWVLVASVALAAFSPIARWTVLAAAVALAGLNAPLYAFFFRRRGWRFAVVAAVMHLAYLLYSSAVFVIVGTTSRLSRR